MLKLNSLLFLLLLTACNASTGDVSDEPAGATTGGTTTGGSTSGGGTSGGTTGGAAVVSAGWSFPTSSSSVQYAFQGLVYRYIPVTGLGAGPWGVSFSAGSPTWLTGLVNGSGQLVLSGLPREYNKSYVPLDVTYTNGVVTGQVRFSLYVRGDALRLHQWHLENDGVSFFSRDFGISGEEMQVPSAWRMGAMGEGVSVAVSDSGLETTHEDLTVNLLPGQHRNYRTGSSTTGYIATPSHYGEAHGTAVSGLIAAVGWNNLGITGIAPRARLAGFQFIESNQTTAQYVHQATGTFDIFNYSYGSGINADIDDDQLFIAQLRNGTYNGRDGKGHIYVKAAGNEYDYFCGSLTGYIGEFCLPQNANIPAENNSPFWIVVGASNANGVRSSYSNTGSNVWVVAPGGEYGDSKPAVVTTDLAGCSQGFSTTTAGPYSWNRFETYSNSSTIFSTYNPSCSYTSVMNGSSSAAPMVSGVVAQMLSVNPALTWRDVKHILAVTASRIDSGSVNSAHPVPQMALAGHVYEQGWVLNQASPRRYYHNWYGFGRVNADAAITMAKDPSYVALPPMLETNPDFDSSLGHGETGLSVAIPNADAATSAAGLERTASFISDPVIIESVQLKVNITHPRSGQIGIELTSPQNTKSILLNTNNALLHNVAGGSPDADLQVTLTTHAFYGEAATGIWKLKIIDGVVDSNTGTLNNWQVNIIGH